MKTSHKVVRNETMIPTPNLLDLPIELFELIMGFISYDEIAKIRSVCRSFDSCSQRLLNRGFNRVEKYHALCFKRVKSQLPRRESERRSHPLARHCDVLSAIETRLSLLGMTYMKYVDMNLCCFIPGKVIDEIYRVLRFIQNNQNPPRVHELLQELRDISSMAMEYFEEKIAPSLKTKISNSNNVLSQVIPINTSSTTAVLCRALPSTSNASQSYSSPRINSYHDQDLLKSTMSQIKQMQQSQNSIKKEFTDIKVKMKDYSSLKREVNTLKTKLNQNDKSSADKELIIVELRAELEDLKRRMSEYDKKNAHKSIKDEQQVHKEPKIAKKKNTRNAKRVDANKSDESLDEEMGDSIGFSNAPVAPTTRSSKSKAAKQMDLQIKANIKDAKLADESIKRTRYTRKSAANKRQKC